MLKSPVWVPIKSTLAQVFSKSLNIWYRPGVGERLRWRMLASQVKFCDMNDLE